MQLPTSEQDELRATSRKVLLRNASSERIRELSDTDARHDGAFWKQIADLGWLALTVPEQFDGLGMGLPELAVLAEEFGYSLQPCPFTASSVVTWLIGRHGTPTVQDRLLPALTTGEVIASWGLTSPGANGTLSIEENRISGMRRFVPDAHAADLLLVDATAGGREVLALVDATASGITRQTQHTIDLTRRYATVQFDRTPVDPDAVLVLPAALSDLRRAAIALQCAESVGVARRLVEMTISYASTREQFDRPIGSFQAVKHRIADMHIQLEGALAATEESMWAVEQRRSDADVAVHVAKSWTGRAASNIASEALQLHGGIGFTWEHDLHLFLRRAKVNELLLGTPSWHDERLYDALAAGTA
jgi:alkylation response protein AidB-like acyl-CoA dehydrogenase